MIISNQPEQTFVDDAGSEFDAGHRFYDAVLRSGFLMEPGWPNPIRRPVMSVRVALDRLDDDRPAQAVAPRRPGADKDVRKMDESLKDLAGLVPCRGGFGGCGYARAA